MTTAPIQLLPKAKRRRLIGFGLLRASAATAVLVAAYYLTPLDHLTHLPLGVTLAVGLLVLAGITVYEVRAIIRARQPAIRAVEALATTVPLFLLLFAATYFLMAQADGGSFNVDALSRTDSLYFTITVFTTVGFGDIHPVSEAARLIVTTQMILDLIVLGLGIQVIIRAVQRGWQPRTTKQETEAS